MIPPEFSTAGRISRRQYGVKDTMWNWESGELASGSTSSPDYPVNLKKMFNFLVSWSVCGENDQGLSGFGQLGRGWASS